MSRDLDRPPAAMNLRGGMKKIKKPNRSKATPNGKTRLNRQRKANAERRLKRLLKQMSEITDIRDLKIVG